MWIDQLDRFRPSDDRERDKKEVLDKKNEAVEKPENKKEQISTTEAILGAVALGIRTKLFLDEKGIELRNVVDGAKKDILSEPTEVKPIIGRSIADVGSLIIDHLREEKERKLAVRQSFANSLDKLAAKIDQFKILKDFEEIQKESITETTKRPRKPLGLSEEEKAKIRERIEEARNNIANTGKNEFYKFLGGLLNP